MSGPDLTSVLDNGYRLEWGGKRRTEAAKFEFSLLLCVSKITFKHTAICIDTEILNALRYHFPTVSKIPSLEMISISLTIHTSNIFFLLKNPRMVVMGTWPSESHDLVQILTLPFPNYNFKDVMKSL